MGQPQSTTQDSSFGKDHTDTSTTPDESWPRKADHCFHQGLQDGMNPPMAPEEQGWQALGCWIYGKQAEYGEGMAMGADLQHNPEDRQFKPETPAGKRFEEKNADNVRKQEQNETLKNSPDRTTNNNNNTNRCNPPTKRVPLDKQQPQPATGSRLNDPNEAESDSDDNE